MKKILLFILFFLRINNVHGQEKTIDKILDNTKGVLDIINSTKAKKQISKPEQEKLTENEQKIKTRNYLNTAKFIVVNNTTKRITVTLKIISENVEFSKQYVLSNGDKETFKNLAYGIYEYSAKFEDGVIAKSGELEFNEANRTIEKEIK